MAIVPHGCAVMTLHATALIIVAAFSFLIVWAVLSDLTKLRIPNWISIALALLFFVFAVLGSNRAMNVPLHLLIAAGVFAAGLIPYSFRWMGAGDVKLLAVVALWAGPEDVLTFLYVTSLVGAAVGLVIIAGTKYLGWDGNGRDNGFLSNFFPNWLKRRIVPYGLAIGVGALLTIPAGIL